MLVRDPLSAGQRKGREGLRYRIKGTGWSKGMFTTPVSYLGPV